MKKYNIPSTFYKLFEWFCKEELFEELQGDLEESFYENCNKYGISRARSIYRKEVLKMMRPSVFKSASFTSGLGQLSGNYLKTSIRTIKLNPFYISANVLGLAVALSIATIAFFTNQYVSTFNHSYTSAKELYKIHSLRIGQTTVGASTAAMGPVLEAEGITAIRYTTEDANIRLGDRLFQESVAFADPNFFTYFPNNTLVGGELKHPMGSEVVISRAMAIKLFNEIYPVGKLVSIVFPNLKEHTFIVKEVFEDLPSAVSFSHDIILPMDQYFAVYELRKNDWANWIDGTFVHASNDEVGRIEKQLDTYMIVQNRSNSELTISGFQLANILVWPNFERSLYRSGFKGNLDSFKTAPMIMAGAILLLACFNFINTSIALSGKRLKEIAVRKVLGGNRKSTISQFMIENGLLVSLSVLFSFGVSYFLIPAWNAFFGFELIQLSRVAWETYFSFGLILTVVVTLLSGMYPALYISSFRPLMIFRDKVILSGKNWLMTGLLTFQFALCFFLLFGSFYNIDNASYQETFDRGYQVDQVINIPIERPEQFDILSDRFLQNPNVSEVAGAKDIVGFSHNEEFLNYAGNEHPIASLSVGNIYPEVLDLRLKNGRYFLRKNSGEKEIIINEMLAKELDADVLNKSVKLNEQKYKIVGIVEDFNIMPFYVDGKIRPVALKLIEPQDYVYVTVKMDESQVKTDELAEKVWYASFPQELYNGFLQERVMDYARHGNDMMFKVGVFLGGIALLISVLGLYTLIALTVQRRSKEFGIRKVLGASGIVVFHLLGRGLYWILGIAAMVGLTFAYIQNRAYYPTIYAYYADVKFLHFAGAVVTISTIVLLAIGYKVIQAGRANPVEQLRTE